MKHFYPIIFIILTVFSGCKTEKEIDTDLAQKVVDNAIDVVGGEQFKNSIIEFDFRDRHYKATRDRWKFQLERIWNDSVNHYRDLISNSGYQRYINDSLVKVPDSMARKYYRSINAVHYFSVLPYGLNDKAVNKKYLGEIELKGQPYHKIEVTFNQEGGGEDYKDIFVYWINKNSLQVDYFGYSYIENKEIGVRFRETIKRTKVNGLTLNDYNNYKPTDPTTPVYDLDQLFADNKLQLLSKIELRNISVSLLPTTDQ